MIIAMILFNEDVVWCRFSLSLPEDEKMMLFRSYTADTVMLCMILLCVAMEMMEPVQKATVHWTITSHDMKRRNRGTFISTLPILLPSESHKTRCRTHVRIKNDVN